MCLVENVNYIGSNIPKQHVIVKNKAENRINLVTGGI